MTDDKPDDEPDDELPEAIRLHKALAIACLALELIADDSLPAKPTARAAIGLLRRNHPDAREHLTEHPTPPGAEPKEDP